MSKDFAIVSSTGVKYVLVGGLSALIELILFFLLFNVLHCAVFVSNISAVFCSTIFNFLMNRSFTFSSASNPVRSAVLYLLLFLFNTSMTSLCIAFMVEQLGIFSIVAKLITMGCVVVWNYFLYKKIIFV